MLFFDKEFPRDELQADPSQTCSQSQSLGSAASPAGILQAGAVGKAVLAPCRCLKAFPSPAGAQGAPQNQGHGQGGGSGSLFGATGGIPGFVLEM